MRGILHRLTRLRRDRWGNVAIFVAIVSVPLVAVAALAVDVGNAASAKASLDAAADTAALLATTVASNQYLAGVTNPTTAAQTAAAQRFSAQSGSINNVNVKQPLTISVTQSGTTFSSTITYSGAYQTALAGIVGVTSIPFSGTASASISINPYIDIQVLMDVSASMLIAATPTDIANMQVLTTNFQPTKGEVVPDNAGQQCAFACHWNTLGTDYLALAQSNAVTLRIDVLRAAVGNLITNIASLNKQAGFRLGLSTFAQAFTQIYPLNTNISGASTALASIAPDVNMCSSNCPETYFASAVSSLAAATGVSGNGASQATSQKYVFIVTDGLVDQMTGSSRVIGPITAANCAALKAQGITVLTLYTPYLPLTNNSFYNTYVWPYQSMGSPDDIQQGMAACASAPNFAFVATNAAQIDAQLQTMLATVLQTSGHLIK